MNNEVFTIVGIVLFLGFFVYIIARSLMLNGRIIEGLTNPIDSTISTTMPTTSTATSTATSTTTQNIASGAANYGSKINVAFSQLKDQMNVPKYRSDYENVIIQLDDYISMLTLQTIMSMDANAINDTSASSLIARLNIFSNARTGLDTLMKYIDGVT